MKTNTKEIPSDYLGDLEPPPRDWFHSIHKEMASDYAARSRMLMWLAATKSSSLDEVLRSLESTDFSVRLFGVPEGREDRYFEKDPDVDRLVASLKAAGSSGRKTVNSWLDAIFSEIRPGEMFEHLSAAMALLFALKRVDIELFDEIASVFAKSRATEVARLSRYATRLLAR